MSPAAEQPTEVALGASDEVARAARFEAMVESSEDAILSKDRSGVITSWNPAAERLYGFSAEEAIGQPISLIIPDDRADEEKEILGRILAGQRLSHYETERVSKDGGRVSVSLTVSPIRDAAGEVVGASVVARDITERITRRRRAAQLHEITSALAREAEPDRAIEVLLSDGLEILGAEAAAVGLLDESRERVELADAVGYSEQSLAEWKSFPLDAGVPMSVAIRNLDQIWSPSTEDLLERFPSLGKAPIPFAALAVLPLAVEQRPLGAISFSFAHPRQFGAEERAFMGSIVQQAAYTLERARLYDSERQARQRLSFLARASEVLTESLDVNGTLRRLAELSVRHMSDWCAVDLAEPDGGVRNVVTAHVDRSREELAREFRRRYPPEPDAPTGSAHVIRTGEPEIYGEVSEEMLRETARDEEHLKMMRELGLASGMVVPLIARGRTLGAIAFASSDPDRVYGQQDLELAQDLARRAALAIDTSVLYHRAHETALTLQRALLPRDLPKVAGIEVAARYLPAEAGLEVGGDWYDLIEPGPGRVEVVIGDVSGRGVHAAAVMGRLAAALRAYVLDGRPPEATAASLDRLLKALGSSHLATLFELSLEPVSGRARYVRAGHPPALLRLPDGEVVELSGEGSSMLGPLSEPRFVANELTLPPGSTLLLYTDGLIERRRLDLQIGIERLKEVLATAPAEPERLVEAIPPALGAEQLPDDIALLALRYTGSGT